MKLIDQSHEIICISSEPLKMIEKVGRICYKSEDKITPDSAEKFVRMLIDKGHHAMLEFGYMTVKFITNRGVTHELVRHRPCSFAQESTRYVNYGGKNMQFIYPVWLNPSIGCVYKTPSATCTGYACITTENTVDCKEFRQALCQLELSYNALLKTREVFYNASEMKGWQSQQAREVLPNALKTEIAAQANFREWRHIFSLRCSTAAHPQMRALMLGLLKEVKALVPVLFDDIYPEL